MSRSPLINSPEPLGNSVVSIGGIPTVSMDKELPGAPSPKWRFMNRSRPFGQSNGALNIRRVGRPAMYWADDWVHSLLNRSTQELILYLFLAYVVSFLVFAPFYWWFSSACSLKLRTFRDAIFLSIETMTTVGYGISGTYMNGCVEGMLVVTVQSILSVVMGAVVVGGIWLRISRVQVRASTVVFSDKAVVQEIRGSLYFMFQVCDLRKHQLVETRVRCYTLQQKPSFTAATMRLQRPDDQLNSLLLLAVPAVVCLRLTLATELQYNQNYSLDKNVISGRFTSQICNSSPFPLPFSIPQVVHRIDAWSPLEPPVNRDRPNTCSGDNHYNNTSSLETAGGAAQQPHDPSVAYRFPDLPLRACDLECGAREAKGPLAGCGQAEWGQTGGALEGKWLNSGAVPAGGALLESNHAAPPFMSARTPTGVDASTTTTTNAPTIPEGSAAEKERQFAGVSMAKRQAIQDWLVASGTEVLAILEGQENMQGNVVQVHLKRKTLIWPSLSS